MIREYPIYEFLQYSEKQPVIDVRSPGEFRQGHIPGAVNIPLFDNEERAVIGTIFTKTGSEQAIRRGYEIAGPKVPYYLAACREAANGSRNILVHCWRGGMRSRNMAELFSENGYETGVLTGGYKAYRKFTREEFSKQAKIIVIGGYTGSGKTEVLRMIALAGEQVIDLEGQARHKGSVFGALGQEDQPTNEQFENDLGLAWRRFDLTAPVWMEDESRMIGNVSLPEPVLHHVNSGLLVRMEMSREARVRRLVSEYAGFDHESLVSAISRLEERLGGTRLKEAVSAIRAGAFSTAIEIVLQYYDKAYDFAINRRSGQKTITFPVPGPLNEEYAMELVKIVRNLI
jgi:tRNA 2-selenouridine synthase